MSMQSAVRVVTDSKQYYQAQKPGGITQVYLFSDREVQMRPNFYTQKSSIRLKLDPKKVQRTRT